MQVWTVDEERRDGWLALAAETVRAGGVVAIPTDTFYGLAADCRSSTGIAAVLALKGRSEQHPLLLLVADASQIASVATGDDPRIARLAADFWPGPLTLVLPARPDLHPALVGPSGGVAVRLPDSDVVRDLSRRVGSPITGTSANRTGMPPASRVDELDLPAELLAGAIDAGATPGGLPSTLVDLTVEPARLLRSGAVPTAELARSLGGRLV